MVAIIVAICSLLGLSIFAFSDVSEKTVAVVKEPIEEVGNTLKIATIPILIIVGYLLWKSQ